MGSWHSGTALLAAVTYHDAAWQQQQQVKQGVKAAM
jgi:hypothetical protein